MFLPVSHSPRPITSFGTKSNSSHFIQPNPPVPPTPDPAPDPPVPNPNPIPSPALILSKCPAADGKIVTVDGVEYQIFCTLGHTVDNPNLGVSSANSFEDCMKQCCESSPYPYPLTPLSSLKKEFGLMERNTSCCGCARSV